MVHRRVTYDHNQLAVPDSFLALFLTPGREKPSRTRDDIAQRYEPCEDLANHLVEPARAQHHDQGLATQEVLSRCHAGLCAEGSTFSAGEAAWIVRRLAELEGWVWIVPAEVHRHDP